MPASPRAQDHAASMCQLQARTHSAAPLEIGLFAPLCRRTRPIRCAATAELSLFAALCHGTRPTLALPQDRPMLTLPWDPTHAHSAMGFGRMLSRHEKILFERQFQTGDVVFLEGIGKYDISLVHHSIPNKTSLQYEIVTRPESKIGAYL
eukprot:g39624.t1